MIDLNQQPYYDDFNKDGEGVNPNLRILFRPGYPVQARELTQIQSTVQSQISRFGSHIFKDGSKVSGGDLSINKIKYLVLDPISLAPNTPVTMEFLAGKELSNASGTVRAKIVPLTKSFGDTESDSRSLAINYTTSGEFGPSEVLHVVNQAITVQTDSSNHSGEVTVASINSGVFYVKGFFVYTEPQAIVIGPSWTENLRIGLNVSDLIVTESEDNTLLDPAFGSYNYNAPGAHRYRINLELATRLLTDVNEVDPNFVEFVRVDEGEIVSEVKNPKYNELEHEFARRTYDESGSYTVRPFQISFEDHETDDTKVNVVLDAGKAYVFGYEMETIGKTVLEIDKARDTEFYNNTDAYMRYGQYYVVSSVAGGMFNPNALEQVTLHDDSATNIGSARVKAVYRETDTTFRVYLTDIQCSDSNAVRTVRSGSKIATVDISGGTIDLLRGTRSLLLAPFYPENPKAGSLVDVNYQTQRFFVGNLDAEKRITISTSTSNERFVGNGLYTGSDSFIKTNYTFVVDGVEVSPTSVDIPTVGSTEVGRMLITFASGTTVQLLANIEVNSSTPKTKLRKTDTQTIAVGTSWVELSKADVIPDSFEVSSDGVDVTSQYEFDDGQRDEFYDYGRIRKLSGASSTVTVTYDYYEHSGTGYFAVDSYVGEDYGLIPKYTSGASTYQLHSCFDFRPLINAGAIFSQIPVNNSAVSFDYEYFVPRYDLVVASKSKQLIIVRGVPEMTPKVPQAPADSMVLYTLRVSPYTITKDDIGVRFIENRRYTMRDIGKLEKRIENLEYYTSLSLLESKASTISVEGRFRNGFLVDSFAATDVADFDHFGFNCFINTSNQTCSPSFVPFEAELSIDQLPSDVILTPDDMIVKKYSEATIISQKVITGIINVNPYNVFNWVGMARLTPAVDNWVVTDNLPDVINTITVDTVPAGWRPTFTPQGDPTLSASITLERRGAAANEQIRQFIDRFGVTLSGGVGGAVNWGTLGTSLRFTEQVGVRDFVQERTVETDRSESLVAQSVIPYIRAKSVKIDVTGLLPNTRYYFKFDDRDVNTHVGPTSATSGQPVLSDASGTLVAWFNIPNNVFKTGSRLLRISDDPQHRNSEEISFASTEYTAQGFLQTKQRTISMSRIREIATEVETRRTATSSGLWADPLAQTFLVDENVFPEGVFLSSVDLYFTSKDTVAPVTVSIRPTINGYPSSTLTYAFASKTLTPDSVVVNSTSTTEGYADTHFLPTRFKFDTPIYLSPGEHSFVVMSNSNEYTIGYAEIREKILNTNMRMSENPYNGVMFTSQNASTWSADQSKDICFKLNRAVFDTTTTNPIVWKLKNADTFSYDTLNFETDIVSFDGTDHRFDINVKRLDGARFDKVLSINTMLIMDGRHSVSDVGDIVVTGRLYATNVLSPVLDAQKTFLALSANNVNNDATGEDSPNGGAALSRYIHKSVTLTDDFVATELRVWLDGYVPAQADIKVYLRHQNTTNDSTPFYDKGWTEVPLINTMNLEREYRISVPSGFTMYQTKVVLISSDPSKVPVFSNFRVVTFQE